MQICTLLKLHFTLGNIKIVPEGIGIESTCQEMFENFEIHYILHSMAINDGSNAFSFQAIREAMSLIDTLDKIVIYLRGALKKIVSPT